MRELEVVTVALSTEHSYNDEETLATAKPTLLIHGYDQLLPKLRDRGILS